MCTTFHRSRGTCTTATISRTQNQLNTYGNSTTNSRGRKQFAVRHNQNTDLQHSDMSHIHVLHFRMNQISLCGAHDFYFRTESHIWKPVQDISWNDVWGNWCEEKLSPYTDLSGIISNPPLINKINKPSRTFTMFPSLPGMFKTA